MLSFSHRMMHIDQSEGLCGPRAPAPKAFGLWTPAAELTCTYDLSWFPLLLGGTRIFQLAVLCFWPGVPRTPPRMRSIRGKPGNNPQGKRAFPADFPGLSWARNPQTFVTPARQADVVGLSQRRNFARYGSRDEPSMTACGGNLIGGEISRNKQCPHEADLRRLRLRTVTTLAQVWGRGAPSVIFIGSAICKWKRFLLTILSGNPEPSCNPAGFRV